MADALYKFRTLRSVRDAETGRPAERQVFLFALQLATFQDAAYYFVKSILSQPLSNEAPVDSMPAKKIGSATIFW